MSDASLVNTPAKTTSFSEVWEKGSSQVCSVENLRVRPATTGCESEFSEAIGGIFANMIWHGQPQLGEQPKIVVDPGHDTLSLKEPGNRRLSPADIQVNGRDRLTVRIENISGEAGGVSSNHPDATSPLSNTPLAQGTSTEPISSTQLAGPTIRNTVGMQLRLIPAGAFTMGSPRSEKSRNPGEDQHRVILTQSFYLGVTEVTQQ